LTRRPPPHPWLTGLDRLPPGKRAHVRRITAALVTHLASRRAEAVDLVHPLLTQPMLELCLSLPTMQLTAGRRGRDLARRAFGDRLPEMVRERRSKGDLSADFGRALAASLPALRAHLLDGRLAAEGVIDRERTDAVLDADHLAWRGDYGDVMTAAAIESWVRVWEARLERWRRTVQEASAPEN
jgi:asparagine synthase (glutamine-hydrolysing)